MGAFQTLGHINFKTRDLARSIAFYKRLGFEPFLELTQEDGRPWIVYLRFDDMLYLELTGGGPAAEEAPGPEVTGFNHLCITVDDIEVAAKELGALGVPLMHPLSPGRGLDSNRGAWVADPDGNRIELMQMSTDCAQYEAIKAFKAGKGMTSLVRPLK